MSRVCAIAFAALVFFQLSASAQAADCDKPELTREQLIEIALREANVRGVRVDGPTEVKVTEHDCEYDVLVSRKPPGPGEYFFVIIGRDKQIVAFRRGL